MVKDLRVKKIKDEATEILVEMKRIKIEHTAKWTFPFLSLLNKITGILFASLFISLFITMRKYLENQSIFETLLAVFALSVSLLGSVYIPIVLSVKTDKFYTYSYKIKNKQSANELMVALFNVKVKSVGVAQINTIYNGKDMYLEIKYK
ncbi:MAG: hypothetical protein VB047_10915 [Anaerotignum propionicum]|uniref:hypothetical protein n=1 Tax=Anaerotignum propionicum TaxID=28446 RepID=UPI002B21FFFE|nr:hypothetical protein [Anaerotignum propionicum]MEA5058054.1 hypothetical protein [Anaerotignum propionicum]